MKRYRPRRIEIAASAVLACGFVLVSTAQNGRNPGSAGAPPTSPTSTSAPSQRGLLVNSPAACAGYTLLAPIDSTTTYLVDMQGDVTHSWPSKYTPGQAAYLLDDGTLLRTAREPENEHFGGGGIGGRVERLAPDSSVLWDFVYADERHCLHHDIAPLPNGHILMIAWEKKTRDEALSAGFDPARLRGDALWPDCLIEVAPREKHGGDIVWEWHTWDHLVQQLDGDKPNYGAVAEHPELIDANYERRAPRESRAEMQRLRTLGYVGGAPTEDEREDEGDGPPGQGPGFGPPGMDLRADWCHTNSVAYLAQLDQIVLSVHTFNEIWIIDHSTTTAEAAGHSGGRAGRGGDLLYRWGNPRAYGAGTADDQQLFAQHDARWIPSGRPGAGHMLVFNNGTGRPGEPYSSVVELELPVDSAGRYELKSGSAYGPAKPFWEYAAAEKTDFFASHISGAERLANGNTLVCDGEEGRIFEVTQDGQRVWDYVNPHVERQLRPPGGGPPPFGGPGPRRFRDGRRPDHATSRPARPQPGMDGPPRGRRPRGPGFGPPFGGPGGPPGGAGLFRAARYAVDDPGVRHLLASAGHAVLTK